jgi:hypothetical protein
MIIYLLSDSKHTLENRHENYSLIETWINIDNQEYIIHVVLFLNNFENDEYKIRLYRKNDMELIISGKEFNLIDTFYTYDDNFILRGHGKKGELYYLDSDCDIHEIIKYNTTNNLLQYSESLFNNEDYYFKLVTEDVNLLKFISIVIEDEDEVFRDLDYDELTSLSDFTASLLGKFRGRLYLGSLEYLSDESAKYLAKHIGLLDISNISNISEIGIAYLSNHKGPVLTKSIDLFSKEVNGFKIAGYDEYPSYFTYKLKCNEKSIEFFVSPKDEIIQVVFNNLYLVNGITLLRAIGISSNFEILQEFGFTVFSIENSRQTLESFVVNNTRNRFCFADNIYRNWIEDFIDEDTGETVPIERSEILCSFGDEITEENISLLIQSTINEVPLFDSSSSDCQSIISTLKVDRSENTREALMIIYNKLNGIDTTDVQVAKDFLYSNYLNQDNFYFDINWRSELDECLYDDYIDDLEQLDSMGLGLREQDIVEIIRNLSFVNIDWES